MNPTAALTLDQALAAAALVTSEPQRIMVRNQILLGLRDRWPERRTAAEDARALAGELREPERGGFYSDALATVRRLSRARKAPTAHQIVRVLRAGEASLAGRA